MENLIIIGMKNAGKSTISKLIAEKRGMKLISLDVQIEKKYSEQTGNQKSFREIYKNHGKEYFRNFETSVLKQLFEMNITNTIIDLGGGTAVNKDNWALINKIGKVIWIKLSKEINYQRIIEGGTPVFFEYQDDPRKSFDEIVNTRFPIYEALADIIIEYKNETPEQINEKINNII